MAKKQPEDAEFSPELGGGDDFFEWQGGGRAVILPSDVSLQVSVDGQPAVAALDGRNRLLIHRRLPYYVDRLPVALDEEDVIEVEGGVSGKGPMDIVDITVLNVTGSARSVSLYYAASEISLSAEDTFWLNGVSIAPRSMVHWQGVLPVEDGGMSLWALATGGTGVRVRVALRYPVTYYK